MAGLAGGADAAYIHEEKFGIQELMKDLDIMAFKMDKGNIFRGLVLRNECANSNYDTDFLYRYVKRTIENFCQFETILIAN